MCRENIGDALDLGVLVGLLACPALEDGERLAAVGHVGLQCPATRRGAPPNREALRRR